MAKFLQMTAFGGYLGLLILLVVGTVWLAPPQALPRSLVLIVLVGPLLIPLRGILHGRTRAYLWAALLSLFYFVVGIFNIAGGIEPNWLAWLEMLLSLLLFFSALGFVRSADP